MASALAHIGALVTSIDIDFETLVRARDKLISRASGRSCLSRLVLADASRLPFPSGVFDAVFCFDSMHHMADCAAAADEMERVLKLGGRLIITDLNRSGLSAIRTLNAERGESHEENGCGLEDLSRILRRDGSRVDRHDYDFVSVCVKEKGNYTLTNAWTPPADCASAADFEAWALERE